MPNHSRQLLRYLAGRLLAVTVAAAPMPALAQSALQSGAPETPSSFLQQLSEQTVALHHRVVEGSVRLRLPDRPQIEINPAEELLRKWESRLEPAVRQTLRDELIASRALRQKANPFAIVHSEHGDIVMLRPFDPSELAGQLPLGLLVPRVPAASQMIGLVMDDQGLVLLPAFTDRDDAIGQRIRGTAGHGAAVEAAWIGSDRPTNLTLVRIQNPVGRPIAFADGEPRDGAIVMIFSPQTEASQLAIWNDAWHDSGVVITVDGQLAGFASNGQFQSAAALKPVIEQMEQLGAVRRAVMGIHVSEIGRDDPIREQGLGRRAAMRVDNVLDDSPAKKAGILEGDLLLAIADQPVGDLPDIAAALAGKFGSTDLHILRNRIAVRLTIQLTAK